jgi:hypothetical protein
MLSFHWNIGRVRIFLHCLRKVRQVPFTNNKFSVGVSVTGLAFLICLATSAFQEDLGYSHW